jgi:preprotein translocase subunit SecG
MATFLYFTAIFLLLILCLLLCGVIMIQESKSSGLGASFGGESSDSLFGTATADVLKQFTGWLSAIFMVTCILLSFWTANLARSKTSDTTETIIEEAQTH